MCLSCYTIKGIKEPLCILPVPVLQASTKHDDGYTFFKYWWIQIRFCIFTVYIHAMVCLHGLFSSATLVSTLACVYVWVNCPCRLCKTVNIHDCSLCTSLHCTHYMDVHIWLHVGRWQNSVHTTSVLAVCACGFLHLTAASSTQPHRSSVFSVCLSDIVNIITACFTGWVLSLTVSWLLDTLKML